MSLQIGSDGPTGDQIDPGDVPTVGSTLELSKKEWRKRLTDEEFEILRNNGTEPAGSGDLLDEKREGIYYCAGCGAPVFSSRHKYGSKTGWPSFYRPYDPDRLGTKADTSLGMTRTEVHCARCGGHLGHVFDDGPQPTGRRYCINSVALDLKPVSEIQSGSDQPDADQTGGDAGGASQER
ncbi:MAG: peptide-methionine (R)-S-oxide reductase MsrB [Bradymonadaceae bacterium]